MPLAKHFRALSVKKRHKMAVKTTKVLKNFLTAEGLNTEELCRLFADWKSSDEYGSYYFGKDSAYITPKVDGKKYALRHVHLVPLLDKNQLAAWNKADSVAIFAKACFGHPSLKQAAKT
jgi:hypothetical protein